MMVQSKAMQRLHRKHNRGNAHDGSPMLECPVEPHLSEVCMSAS